MMAAFARASFRVFRSKSSSTFIFSLYLWQGRDRDGDRRALQVIKLSNVDLPSHQLPILSKPILSISLSTIST